MSNSTTQPIPLNQLTAQALRGNQWRTALSELYVLEATVEDNSGHDHQDVLTHTISVMAGIETVIEGKFLTESQQGRLIKYLDQQVDTHTHLELLRAAVVTHDIMKPAALVKDKQGNTTCPAHEILAVARVPEFQARFNLSEIEVRWVQEIVRQHGFPWSLLDLVMTKPGKEAELFAYFTRAVGLVALELIILIYADILGGKPTLAGATDHPKRIQFCETWIQRQLATV